MALLLIDNYDSYTYNLFQLLAEATGRPPRTVRNDAVSSWEDLCASLPEPPAGVVISPGPGSPELPGDFGVCAAAYHAGLPLLGVCLGHQGLALAFGGAVHRAREVMHGRISTVHHDGEGLFAAVPEPFEAVRYHSLVVDPHTLPSCLRVTARTADGVVMALRHASLPLFGVHFHPESVCTEGGVAILRNFARIAGCLSDETQLLSRRISAPPSTPPPVIDGRQSFVQRLPNTPTLPLPITAPIGGAPTPPTPDAARRRVILVSEPLAALAASRSDAPTRLDPSSVEPPVELPDAEDLFDAFYSESPVSFWLDSSSCTCEVRTPVTASTLAPAAASAPSAGSAKPPEAQRVRGRYSFMGAGGGPHSAMLRCASGGQISKFGRDGSETRLPEGTALLPAVREMLAGWRGVHPLLWDGGGDATAASSGSVGTDSRSATRALPPLPPFRGGLVGTFAYEAWHRIGPEAVGSQGCEKRANGRIEEVQTEGSTTPEAFWLFADRLIAIDHIERRILLLCLCEMSDECPPEDCPLDDSPLPPDCPRGHHVCDAQPRVEAANGGGKKSGKKSGAAAHGSRAEADEWLRETGDAVVRLSKMNLSGKSRVMPSGSGAPSKSEAPRQEAREAPSTAVTASTAGFTSARSESGYMEDVETIFEWLRSGDTYEVCLTTQLHAPAPAPSPLVLYRTLRRLTPAPYAAFLHVDLERLGASSNAAEASQSAFSVCCSSPERFLRVEPSGLVQAKPIKGTAPREACAVADEMSARALRNSEKDCAENLMIVDLIRHDLGRVCRVGSVFVEQLMAIESFATVHQLVSTVSGELEPPLDALDAAAAAFPPGSMTGAPKSRTLRIIDQLEQRKPRGIYSGTLGYFSIDGAADLNVVIRTAITNQDGTWVGTGGAVVALSEPLDEWHEAMLKAQAVLQACQACNKGDAAAR